MAMNDAVDWASDLGGGVRVALIQAGTFRSDAGTLFGPVPWVLWGGLVDDEIDDKRRLLQALNCLLIETPSGRVLVETGIGDRVDDKTRDDARLRGPVDRAALETAGFLPETRQRRGHEPSPFRPRRRPAPRRRRRAPSRTPRSSPSRPSGRSPSATTRGWSPRTSSPSCASSRLGQAGLGRRRAGDPARGVRRADGRPLDRPPGGHRPRDRRRRPDPGLLR